MSIKELIAQRCFCVKCGAQYGACRCFVRLTCKCGASSSTDRESFEAEVGFALPDTIETTCPKCTSEII